MMPPGGGTVYIGSAVTTDREKMQFQLKFALDRALRAEVSSSHIRRCNCVADRAIVEKVIYFRLLVGCYFTTMRFIL